MTIDPIRQRDWANPASLGPRKYVCGYCGNQVSTRAGYFLTNAAGVDIRICPECNRPTYFEQDQLQIPGVPSGKRVEHLPPDINALYEEARRATAAGAPTTAVLAVRKLLMHIAVSQGDDEGKSFIQYVEYLSAKGFVPPGGKTWVDHIRKKGNEANHEIRLMKREDAEELIAFAEMLLKFIYEFPARVPPATP